ncbi:MAG: hypothetical protein QNJ34_19355 [Xenococcaceae cyanobacterium MO_188.B29]|nr:hypothetical protein [Xenococcaceae cyanobacterium MO_188.B29]
MSSFAIPGGSSGFVPPEAKPEPKSVRNRRAAARKAQQNALKQAKTPNANTISPKPNPLKPVGGTGLLGVAALGVAIWAAIEGLFPQNTARSALSEIDPALLYPPSSETIAPPTSANFTGGQMPGQQYVPKCHWTNGTESFSTGGRLITGPILEFNCTVGRSDPWGTDYVTEVVHVGHDGTTIDSYTVVSRNSPSYAAYPPRKTVEIWGGGVDTGGDPPPIDDGIVATSTPATSPIPFDNEFFQRDSYTRYEPLSKGGYKPNPPVPKPKPPKPEQIIDANPVTADGRVAQPTPTPTPDISPTPIQVTNQKNELDSPTIPADISPAPTPTQQESSVKEATKENIKEPTTTVEWKSTGTGTSAVKVTTQTTADGIKTVVVSDINGRVISGRRDYSRRIKHC